MRDLRRLIEAEDNVVNLVKKPKATSMVWNYFRLEANENNIPKVDKE